MPTSRNRKKNKPVIQPVKRIHLPAFLENEAIKDKVITYREMMKKINIRMNTLQSFLAKNGERKEDFDMETVALNFRKILELLIYANLESNREDYYSIHAPERRDWNIKLLIDRIKLINPRYFPIPIIVTAKEGGRATGVNFKKYTGLSMDEDDMITLFNYCGKLLHEDKVDAIPIDAKECLSVFTDWYYKLRGLLMSHFVFLTNTQRIIATFFRENEIRVVLLEAEDIETPLKV